MVCPNTNTPEWKALEGSVGKVEAYKLWMNNNLEVPQVNDISPSIHGTDHFPAILAALRNSNVATVNQNAVGELNLSDLDKSLLTQVLGASSMSRIELIDEVQGLVAHTAREGIEGSVMRIGNSWIVKYPSGIEKVFENEKDAIDASTSTDKYNVFLGSKQIGSFEWVEDILSNIQGGKRVLLAAAHRVFNKLQKAFWIDNGIKKTLDRPKFFRRQKTQNEVLDELKKLLQDSGISITSIEAWQEKTSKSVPENVAALADMANKLIALKHADNTNDPSILAEEIAHIVLAGQPATDLAPMLELVEQTDEWIQLSDGYMEAYQGDVQKVKMEILGQIMGKRIIKAISADTQRTNYSLLRRLREAWRKFIESFKPTDALKQYLDSLSRETLKSRINTNNIGSDVFFSIDMRDYRENFDSIIESLEQRFSALRRRNYTTTIAEQLNNLEEEIRMLKELRDTDSYAIGYVRFIEFLNEDLNAALNFVASARAGLVPVNANQIMQLGDFISYYEPYIDVLQKFMDFGNVTIFSQNQINLLYSQVTQIKDGFTRIRHFRDLTREDQFLKIVRSWWARELGLDETAQDLDDQIFRLTGGYDIKGAARKLHAEGDMLKWYFGSLRDSPDPLLRLIYAKVMRVDQKVQLDTLNFAKDVSNKARELGIKNQDRLLERDKGKRTGYYLERTRRREWKNAKDKFFAGLRTTFKIPDDPEARMIFMEQWKDRAIALPQSQDAIDYKEYRDRVSSWFKNNTTPKSDMEIERIIMERQKFLTQTQYEEWLKHNIIEVVYPNGATYRIYTGELSEPSDGRTIGTGVGARTTVNWLNPEYARLQPNEKEFLEYLVEQKRMIDSILPGHYDDHRAPQISDNTLDIVRRKFDGSAPRRIRDNMVDEITVRETEDNQEFGEKTLLRPDGSKAKYVPIYYTRLLGDNSMTYEERLDETDKISTDLTYGLIAYFDMAHRWRGMSALAPEMELIAEQAGHREFQRKNGERLAGSETAISKQLRTFIDMQVYGMKTIGGEQAKIDVAKNRVTNFLGLGGKTLSFPKILKQLGKYVRANNLGLNFFTTASNAIQSHAYHRIEDLVGRFTTPKSSIWGENIFWKNIFHVISQAGTPVKNNKMYLFMEAMGLQGDSKDLFANVEISKLSRRALESGLYTSYELIEFWRNSRVMLAIMHNYRKAADGKWYNNKDYKAAFPNMDFESLPNLYDLSTVSRDGKLDMPITTDEFLRLASRTKFVSESIDGKLNKLDYAAAHQHFVAQLVTIHRGWLLQGLQRRLKGKGINVATQDIEEGYWRTTASFIAKTFAHPSRMQFIRQSVEEWNRLSPMERENVTRMGWEIVYSMMATVFAIILNGLADDDDDYMMDVAAYMSNRALMEVGAFTFPIIVSELSNTLANPLVPMRQVELMFDFSDMLFGGEEIDRGQWKGYSKRERAILRLIPGVKGLSLIRDPNAANQFLKNKPLRSVPYEWYGN